MHSLYHFLHNQTRETSLDLSDLLRNEFVMAVSSLDQFVHELIRQGMLDIYDGTKTIQTKQYLSFPLCLRALSFNAKNKAINAENKPILERDAFDAEVVNYLSLRTYQRPDDISQGLHLISPKNAWGAVGKSMKTPASSVKLRLNLIVDQRNAIVHQAHIDPITHLRIPIMEQDSQEATTFIANVIEALFQHFA
jgi:hypothetical protein